jgi:hypothetical protein
LAGGRLDPTLPIGVLNDQDHEAYHFLLTATPGKGVAFFVDDAGYLS